MELPPNDELERFEVLVVDDDAGIRELLVEFFRDRGLIVASTPDGRAAVSALNRSGGRYRLVLTDVAMPGADGFAVLAAARAANPLTYVVIITGYASIDSAISAVRQGAQDYLAKPFSLGQIEVILQQARARFKLEKENLRLSDPNLLTTLESIDHRLATIERAVEELTARDTHGSLPRR